MKKLFLISTTLLSIFLFSFSAFCAESEHFEDLQNQISGSDFTGNIYNPSSTVQLFASCPSGIDDEYDGWYSSKKITSPTWFKSGNNYYLVLESQEDKLTYEDDNGNEKKTSVYAIDSGSWLEDTIAVVKWNSKYYAYYFDEEGVCSNAISSTKGTVEFNSSGKVTKNYEIEIDIKECNLDVYESDDFDGTKGVFDKDSNKKLYNGYWILDKGNDKYDLYNANSSGSSSTVSGATNKSAYELYTIINNKNYIQKASTSSNNNTTTNTSNNTTNTNTNTTSNKDITKNVTKTTKEISTNLNSNDYSFKVVNGSVQLILNNGYKFLDAGTYYYDGFLITIDSNGKETSIEESDPGSYKDITNSSLQTIKIDGNKYRIIK